MQVNPLGTVPAFRNGGTFMTESAAIVQYLAMRYAPNELVLPVHEPAQRRSSTYLVSRANACCPACRAAAGL